MNVPRGAFAHRISLGAVVIAVAMVGCASGTKKAEDSAVDLARKVVIDSVPLAGMPVHAVLGAGGPDNKGDYLTSSQLFCPPEAKAVPYIKANFTQLCVVKGGGYDDRFCTKAAATDSVIFMAVVERNGTSNCMRLTVAEPTGALDAPDYLAYLVSRGYKTVAERERERQVLVADANARAQAQRERDERLRSADRARLAVDLPQMKKRGTRVCRNDGRETYSGYVEDFTDEKLKVLLIAGYLTRTPSMGINVAPGTMVWDDFAVWRLC